MKHDTMCFPLADISCVKIREDSTVDLGSWSMQAGICKQKQSFVETPTQKTTMMESMYITYISCISYILCIYNCIYEISVLIMYINYVYVLYIIYGIRYTT